MTSAIPLHSAIVRMLDLSTAHLSEKTALLLLNTPPEQWPITGWLTPAGFMICVPENSDDIDAPDLRACVQTALSTQCQYILFDRDASRIDALMCHNW